jgi:hypothetical protein
MSDRSDKARPAPAEAGRTTEPPKPAAAKPLSEAARRALAEAAERRAVSAPQAVDSKKEIKERDGPDPTRYGDWENKGIASDF